MEWEMPVGAEDKTEIIPKEGLVFVGNNVEQEVSQILQYIVLRRQCVMLMRQLTCAKDLLVVECLNGLSSNF